MAGFDGVIQVWSLTGPRAEQGAVVRTWTIHGVGITIPALWVGETGRGRLIGVLPVEGGTPGERLLAARIGSTRSGRPKLIPAPLEQASPEAVLVVCHTVTGYRGGNAHTGDRRGWICECGAGGQEVNPPTSCPNTEGFHLLGRPQLIYNEFPGQILVWGEVGPGGAVARELVAVIPRGVVFRTAYTGRLYGRHAREHYHLWNGSALLTATWEERQVADLW
ncbi:MAG: hypothetical protein KatS3mg051_2304 [Anaerolineae bacterium]|nr:MAG: hypothetical protein KatS3mg051_2211 [Anaerolineae bacterium]GIV82950.1 MAG: hypothetical protein KatS3mg051_2304 [Anaerolineae bacterium]